MAFNEIISYKQSRISSRQCSMVPPPTPPKKGNSAELNVLRRENMAMAEQLAAIRRERYMEQHLLKSFARLFGSVLGEDLREAQTDHEVIEQCQAIVRVIQSADIEYGIKKETMLFDSLHSTLQ